MTTDVIMTANVSTTAEVMRSKRSIPFFVVSSMLINDHSAIQFTQCLRHNDVYNHFMFAHSKVVISFSCRTGAACFLTVVYALRSPFGNQIAR